MEIPNINSIVNFFGQDIITEMQNELKENGSIASSRLLNSLKYEAKTSIEQILITWSSEDYAKYVESGRKPGSFPPISKIKEWCKVKGIPEKAAFPIARSIWKLGIKPKPFLLQGIHKKKQDFIVEVIKLYSMEIIAEIKEAFKEITVK